MSEPKNVLQTPPTEADNANDDQQPIDDKPTLEDLKVKFDEQQKMIEELTESNKRLSGSISAKDKSLNSLQTELSDIKKKGMSEQEKAIAEANEQKAFIVKQAHSMISETMGLDEQTAGLISGETGQEIKEKADILKNYTAKVLSEANAKIADLEKQIETLQGNMPNPGSTDGQATSMMSYAAFAKLTGKEQAKFMQEGGRLKE